MSAAGGMADALVLETSSFGSGGSSPSRRTKIKSAAGGMVDVGVLKTPASRREGPNPSRQTNFLRPRRETGYLNGVLTRTKVGSNPTGASKF